MKTLVIDIETTGLPPKGSDYKIDFMSFPRIVSLAYKINDEKTKEFIICQNGVLMSDDVVAIHGITNETANASPYQLEGVLIELMEKGLFDRIVGHNLYFDTSIIKANILRLIQEERITDAIFCVYEELLHKDRRIDTMRAGQKLCGGKWPKLTELYQKLFNRLPEVSHSSGSDVDSTYECFVELKKIGVIQ